MAKIDEERRTSFDSEAELYDAARPSYAEPLVDEVVAYSRIPPDGRILEVGAGTGKATVLFARRGYSMLALEPGENLAQVLRRNVAAFPKVEIEIGTFEAWTGPAFDLVISAQAFHWVDPAVRYRKAAEALRPGGALALIRNEQRDLDPALRGDLDAAYARFSPALADHWAKEVEARRRELADEIEQSGFFGPTHSAVFPWTVRYTARQYLDLLDTHSDHAVLPPDLRKPLYEAIASAIERHGGVLERRYLSMAVLAFRKSMR